MVRKGGSDGIKMEVVVAVIVVVVLVMGVVVGE